MGCACAIVEPSVIDNDHSGDDVVFIKACEVCHYAVLVNVPLELNVWMVLPPLVVIVPPVAVIEPVV